MQKDHPRKAFPLQALFLLFIASTVVSLLVAALCFFHYFTPLGDRAARLLTVPSLIGQPFDETLLGESGLYQVVMHERYSDEPRGTVLSQDPPAGSERKAVAGRHYVTLTLTVSKGPLAPQIPSVVGMTEEEGRAALLTLGFSPVVKTEYSDRPRGEILRTYPAQGTQKKLGEEITVTVSKGPRFPRVPVPDLIGLSLVEARGLLAASGLSVGAILYRASYGTEGRVLTQSVLPSHRLPIGSPVILTLSRHPSADPPDAPAPTESEHETEPTKEDTSEPLAERQPPSPEDLLDGILGTIFPKKSAESSRKDPIYEATDPLRKDP